MSTINGLASYLVQDHQREMQDFEELERFFLKERAGNEGFENCFFEEETGYIDAPKWGDLSQAERGGETQPAVVYSLVAGSVPSMQKTAEVIDQTASAVGRRAHKREPKATHFTGFPQVKEVAQLTQKPLRAVNLVVQFVEKAKLKKKSTKKISLSNEDKEFIRVTVLRELKNKVKVSWNALARKHIERLPCKSGRFWRNIWKRQVNPKLKCGKFTRGEEELLIAMAKQKKYKPTAHTAKYCEIGRVLARSDNKVRYQMIRLGLIEKV